MGSSASVASRFEALTNEAQHKLIVFATHTLQRWYEGDFIIGYLPTAELKASMFDFIEASSMLDNITGIATTKPLRAYKVITTKSKTILPASVRFKLPLTSVSSDLSGIRSFLGLVSWPKPNDHALLLNCTVGDVVGSTNCYIRQLTILSKYANLDGNTSSNIKTVAAFISKYKKQNEFLVLTHSLKVRSVRRLPCYRMWHPELAIKCLPSK